jgi:ABC-type phosphate transport system auxiliary subunit
MERRLKVDARMAVISVPRELRERLGDPASDSLVEMLRQIGAEQRDDVITMVEERFALRLAETRDDLRSEMHAGFLNLQEQIGSVRAELHKEISHVQEKIGEVHQKIAGQTRWLVTAILAATVLIPIMQKVLAALFPG